jgi:uncharacterized protein (TIGR02246 family)
MKTMHRAIGLLGTTALALFVAGCQKGTATADPEAVKNAIKADEKTWNDQFKSKDSEGLIGHYADNAYFVAPGVKPADGLTPIRKAYADATTDPVFTVSFASDKIDVAASGDMAYARGRFTDKYTDPKTSKVMTDNGSYITVYRKQQDGSWKAVEDFGADDPGYPRAVPPEKPAVRAKMTSF